MHARTRVHGCWGRPCTSNEKIFCFQAGGVTCQLPSHSCTRSMQSEASRAFWAGLSGHVETHTHTRTRAHMNVHMHTCTRARKRARMHTRKRTRAHTRKHAHARAHPCTGTFHKHTSTCACAGICLRERPCLHSCIRPSAAGCACRSAPRRAGTHTHTHTRMRASKQTRARTYSHARAHPCTGTSHKRTSTCACAGICLRERPCLHSCIHPSTAGCACRSAPAGLAKERTCVHELACACAYSHAAFCFLLPSPLLLLMPLVATPVQLPRALPARGHAAPKASRNSMEPRVRLFVHMFV